MMLKVFPACAALAVIGLLLSTVPVRAQATQNTPQELFEGASRMVMNALELLIKAVPQYEAPVILDNGDILIKRKHDRDDDVERDPQNGPDQDRI